MKKNSITFKLFIITTLCLSAFLFLFMIGQTIFFKSYYLNAKISKLKKNFKSFLSMYEHKDWTSNDILQQINSFSNQNNAQIAILDKYGNAEYSPDYQIILSTSNNKKLKIPLNNVAYLTNFQKLKLSPGVKISVEGYFSNDNQLLSLMSIKRGNQTWKNTDTIFTSTLSASTIKTLPSTSAASITPNIISSNKMKTSKVIKIEKGYFKLSNISLIKGVKVNLTPLSISSKSIEGTIDELNIPNQLELMSNYSKTILWNSIDYWKSSFTSSKQVVSKAATSTFHYMDITGRDNIVVVNPIIKDNSLNGFVFTISSLQSVGDAVEAVKHYYIYAFLAALAIIAAMSLLFSRRVSRPLIKMNNVAVKMADLNFSEECDINTKDELGSLSTSLNRLSKNLVTSLGELKTANAQLKNDIDRERELENVRKEFVSSVSHEFKTPLGIMKGFAEGLKDNIAENKRDYYVDVILDEIEKMDELVFDLLDIAKYESKAYKLELKELNIVELFYEIENRLYKQINDKNINLIQDFNNENIEVYCDNRKIEQVITNLMTNAIRHTEKNGLIKINLEQVDDNVLLSIENSGQHIPEEDILKIWDRFYRSEKSRDRRTGGTGLGLCIVKNILELHQSSYGIENTHIGVRAYFTLKRV